MGELPGPGNAARTGPQRCAAGADMRCVKHASFSGQLAADLCASAPLRVEACCLTLGRHSQTFLCARTGRPAPHPLHVQAQVFMWCGPVELQQRHAASATRIRRCMVDHTLSWCMLTTYPSYNCMDEIALRACQHAYHWAPTPHVGQQEGGGAQAHTCLPWSAMPMLWLIWRSTAKQRRHGRVSHARACEPLHVHLTTNRWWLQC